MNLLLLKKVKDISSNGNIKKLFKEKHKGLYLIYSFYSYIFSLCFYLYNLPLEALIYTGSFCFLAALIASFSDYANYKESYKKLNFLEQNILNDLDALPKSLDIRIDYYHKIIEKLYEELEN